MKKRRSQRRIRKYIIFAGITLPVAVCLWLAATFAAGRYATRKLQAIERQYHFNIRYRSVSLRGFNKLRIEGLTVASEHSSWLLQARSFVIKANLWDSSFSGVGIEGFEIERLSIRYTPPAAGHSGGGSGYASLIGQAFGRASSLFAHLPPSVSVNDMRISYPGQGKGKGKGSASCISPG